MGRYWHIACAHHPNPGRSTEGRVVIYGGCKQDSQSAAIQFIGLKDLTILSFGMYVCMSIQYSHGTERLCHTVLLSFSQYVCNTHIHRSERPHYTLHVCILTYLYLIAIFNSSLNLFAPHFGRFHCMEIVLMIHREKTHLLHSSSYSSLQNSCHAGRDTLE